MLKIKARTLLKFFFLTLIAIGIGITGGLLVGCVNSMPSSEELAMTQPKEATKIYDSQGNLLSQIFRENRTFIPLNKISPDMQNAIIAIEDDRFYNHHGIDLKGIARALWIDLTGKGAIQGGSTITQQLAKNVFLSREKTIIRKLQEAVLAIQLEKKYTKEEILEFYLNQIYLGSGAYGVQAAAQTYFDKNADELTLAESALLAALPKAPSYYSPYNHFEAAKKRQELVLDRMAELGYITPFQALEAKSENISLKKITPTDKPAPYFVDYVIQYLTEKYGDDIVYQSGLKVYTTLDMTMQKAAEEALKNYMPPTIIDKNGITQPQGAIIAIEPETGFIKVMVGGRDFKTTQLNRTTQSHRQPGSTFKPFVYTAAIENGYSPYSTIDDSPVTFGNWRPRNYDGGFRGNISLLTALTYSVNVATIKLAEQIGIDTVKQFAEKLGITSLTPEDNNLALAIGGTHKGLTPLEMASAYATLANKGQRITPTCIIKIEDRNGKIIEDNNIPVKTQVISEQTAGVITAMLENVITSGTGRAANIGRPAAGKTGTTDDYKDAWFVGYTPDLAAAVWIGHDQPKPMAGISGGSYPARIWANFMKNALSSLPVKPLFKAVNVSHEAVNIDDEQTDNEEDEDSPSSQVVPEEEQINNNAAPNTTNNKPVNIPAETPATNSRSEQPQHSESNNNSSNQPLVIPDE